MTVRFSTPINFKHLMTKLRHLIYTAAGERPPVNKSFEEMEAILSKAYAFVGQLCSGKAVLDIGCAGGYGATYLATKGAHKVVGIDISRESVQAAWQTSAAMGTNHADFITMDAMHLGFRESSFDVVTCFQVIEHLNDHERFIREAARVLRAGGTLILTTPNKNVTSPGSNRPLFPFHTKEFHPDQLYALLSQHFADVNVMGQEIVNPKYLREEMRFRQSLRAKVIRILSRSSMAACVNRTIPRTAKQLIVRAPNPWLRVEDLDISSEYVDHAYILFAVCKKGSVSEK